MIDSLKNFLNEEQDPKAVEKIYSKLKDLLMTGEEVRYIAVQKKPAVNISPDCVALTDRRIIFCRSKNLGLSMDFSDYVWKDVAGCHIKEGILGTVFTVKSVSGQEDVIDYLPKTQARKLYQVSQEKEIEQEELRRQLDLEAKRAAAGNVVLTTNAPAPDDTAATLQKLKNLYENGLITQPEYEAKKAEILSRI